MQVSSSNPLRQEASSRGSHILHTEFKFMLYIFLAMTKVASIFKPVLGLLHNLPGKRSLNKKGHRKDPELKDPAVTPATVPGWLQSHSRQDP